MLESLSRKRSSGVRRLPPLDDGDAAWELGDCVITFDYSYNYAMHGALLLPRNGRMDIVYGLTFQGLESEDRLLHAEAILYAVALALHQRPDCRAGILTPFSFPSYMREEEIFIARRTASRNRIRLLRSIMGVYVVDYNMETAEWDSILSLALQLPDGLNFFGPYGDGAQLLLVTCNADMMETGDEDEKA